MPRCKEINRRLVAVLHVLKAKVFEDGVDFRLADSNLLKDGAAKGEREEDGVFWKHGA